MTFRKWVGYVLPMNLCKWMTTKFTPDRAVLQVGSMKYSVRVWMTGPEEGFFCTDASDIKRRIEALKQTVAEMEEEYESKKPVSVDEEYKP